jgi:hypothetical protein
MSASKPEAAPASVPPEEAKARYPALSRREFWVLLAVLVIQFLVGAGPVWRNPWDIDWAILGSYVTIPFFVGGLLAYRRRFAVQPWLLHTLELALSKFLVTATLLIGMWLVSKAPPPALKRMLPGQAAALPRARVERRMAAGQVEAAKLPAAELGRIEGVVKAPDGQPAANASVFIAEGLERYFYSTVPEPVVLDAGKAGISPKQALIRVGQPLVLHSTDRRLHAIVASRGSGDWVFNRPALAVGEGEPFVFDAPIPELRLHCALHGASEAPGAWAVLDHPFFTVTDEHGRFHFENVPPGTVWLAARSAEGAWVRVETAPRTEGEPLPLELQLEALAR